MAVRLTDKQRRFVAEYLIDLNATQAAIRAGYSQKTAYSIGQENLTKPEIQKEIQVQMKKRAKRTEITQDKVLQEYARIAFFDPRKLFMDNGRPLEISALDDDTAAALAGLDVLEEYESSKDGKEFVGYTKKYKIANKLQALEALGKHLGLFSENASIPKDEIVEDELSRSLRELGEGLESDGQSEN